MNILKKTKNKKRRLREFNSFQESFLTLLSFLLISDFLNKEDFKYLKLNEMVFKVHSILIINQVFDYLFFFKVYYKS